MTRVTVTIFRGRKVTDQGNKDTNQNSFNFEARPTAGGATWRISLQISVHSVTSVFILVDRTAVP